ncbi:FAD-binding oxidoreductase [Pararhizobium sp. BT-229]|uniref:FAD-binding oxidoreductase n=1 Tax=Pararhizobium sp. BT-229 TaxID=2986923 RepID=UPI0021F7AE54|nr:FAD-binding oxidoreductase [Pararhizobium sp. BT-229]MCV9965167.1 FAD-binding oxidoreductase [Pararhizobium sp. BT-229]
MGRLTRRALLAGVSAGAGLYAGRTLLAPTSATGPVFPAVTEPQNGGILLNDASELSPVSVAKHVTVTADPDAKIVDTIRALMAEAQSAGRPFLASAARHSMGGQSLAKDGSVLTLDQQWLQADPAAKTYRVAAGTRWSTVIAKLDAIGFSPAVMQSNNDFGVASTYSVNAHGWPVRFSGCGSTVRSLKMLLADGTHVTCSRTENVELFQHAMGGYGLFGVITELELDMVANGRLEPRFERVAGADLGKRFAQMLDADGSVQMAYGRLDVSLDRFFEDGLLISYRPAADQSDIPAATGSGIISRVSREIFRRQVGSDGMKHMRWWTETSLGPSIAGQSTRNSLMNEPVVTLDDLDPLRTDILHEYFVAPDRFAEFVALCRNVIPASFQQLLNVTLRYVDADRDSVLAYAAEPRIAAVMLFSQEKTVRGEADMARMTRELIEGVLAIGGTYYLPYRPHASVDQLVRAYPRAGEFVARKREFDKGLLFRNHLWDAYLGKL